MTDNATRTALRDCKRLVVKIGSRALCADGGRFAQVAEQVATQVKAGRKVILCRVETSPDDLKGMLASEGILTARGGVSSHAALVARQLGKVCICGATSIKIDYAKKTLISGKNLLKEGDYISINGTTGNIFAGAIETSDSEVKRVLEGDLKSLVHEFAGWFG